MKGYKTLDAAGSLDFVAHRLLRIVAEGVFEWNGDLFFCPFIKLSGRKKFSLAAWTQESQNSGWAPVFTTGDHIALAGDPLNPELYIQKELRKLDRVLLIGPYSKIFQKERTMIVKNGKRTDHLKFVRKLTDADRSALFPKDGYGSNIRNMLFESAAGKFTILSREEIKRRWKEYLELNKLEVV